MDKGYSINSIDGHVISSIEDVHQGDVLETKMKDGIIISTIQEVKTDLSPQSRQQTKWKTNGIAVQDCIRIVPR